MNINDILIGLINNELGKKRFYSEVATVVSVDEDNMTCEVSFISSNANKTVRLGTVITEDDTAKDVSSIIILPKVDSNVMVTFINETTGLISLYSEVDKILHQVGDQSIQIDDVLNSINGDTRIESGARYINVDENFIEVGGDTDNMVRFSELETAYNKLKDEYDDVVTKLNAVINTLKTWTVVAQDGGAALQAASASLQTASSSAGDISGAKIDEIKTI
jgi:hypothetical protein